MTYSPVNPDRAARLRDLVSGGDDVNATSPEPAPEPAATSVRRRARDVVKRAIAKGIGWYVDEADRRNAEEVSARFAARLAELERLADDVRTTSVNFELLKGEMSVAHAASVNIELLKGEFRSLLATVEDLGRAIAPGAGLEGASVRIAELRERVNALDRRLRHQATAVPVTESRPIGRDSVTRTNEEAPRSALFDYVGFERRFRGDPDRIAGVLADRYADLLAAHTPVLDVGCGRGELLAVLDGRGVTGIGVDTDPGMVVEARARGLDVHEGDAVGFLRQCEEGSLGAVISVHVVEHLELDYLLELLELAATRLRPGGLFIAETPNPMSLIVLGNSYILDPTHVRPLHPSLLTFLLEGAGFRDVELRFHDPATAYHLAPVPDGEAPTIAAHVNAALERLNEVLFGAQEYAAIATTPSG